MIATANADLRGMMTRKIQGENIARKDLLASAKRHGLSPAEFDAKFATMKRRYDLTAAFHASETGQAIAAAKQQLEATTAAVEAAEAKFASEAELAYVRLKQSNAAKEVNDLANGNGEEFQAYAKAMKETSRPNGMDHMLWQNVEL